MECPKCKSINTDVLTNHCYSCNHNWGRKETKMNIVGEVAEVLDKCDGNKTSLQVAKEIMGLVGEMIPKDSPFPQREKYSTRDKWLEDCCRREGFNMAIAEIRKRLE